ncbi:MAG: GTP-binding protein Obg [uncultured Acidimicrobiales bacterium]|uniref:GTPase Obg n=1 Tax=uncultured Acidimicrobiales bacterium TaxID=310071 RepID=A0A6J4IZE4_9ACTN|nr:MAG: GTP-binding protein Obg [uncultured Acidimicrobiales bacterium]
MTQESGFVDQAQLHVKAGNGGAGAVSFRREAHVPEGGPDGGSGGKGGDVWMVADHNVSSLLQFRDHPHRRASDGKHGSGKVRHGATGDDVTVLVPVGTVVLALDGEPMADLASHGDRFLAAEGGRGGRGNASFASARRKAPTFAEQGEVGGEHWFNLELKLMADVALVGFPNAGKSTLISRISAARPKIADYPFTTLEPHLGVVRIGDRELTVADIPGLIEGASEGRGLGQQFLRHIERARALVVLVDLAAEDAGGHSPAEQERILLQELGAYRPELLERPRIVVGSKVDDPRADPMWEGEMISAVTGEGLRPLVGRMADLVDQARADEARVEAEGRFTVHRLVPSGIIVTRDDDGTYVVHGREAERAVALNDLTNPDALLYAQARLKRMGVDKELAKAGARQGDPVRIGKLELDYEEE